MDQPHSRNSSIWRGTSRAIRCQVFHNAAKCLSGVALLSPLKDGWLAGGWKPCRYLVVPCSIPNQHDGPKKAGEERKAREVKGGQGGQGGPGGKAKWPVKSPKAAPLAAKVPATSKQQQNSSKQQQTARLLILQDFSRELSLIQPRVLMHLCRLSTTILCNRRDLDLPCWRQAKPKKRGCDSVTWGIT